MTSVNFSGDGTKAIALPSRRSSNEPRGSQDIQIGGTSYFQGVTGGTLSVAGGISTVLKSAGLTISRYSMSGE